MAIKVIHTKPEFSDDRGYITRLVNDDKLKLRAVLYITSKAGTERGNHYHKKDYHYVYVLSGKFIYSEKDMSHPNSKSTSVILNPGDLVLSKPMIAHSMKFLEDSVFLAITTEPRQQKKYEKDTVRIKITPDEKDQKNVFKLNFCRICKNENLKEVITLSPTSPANAFLTKNELSKKEHFFPLNVNFCTNCGQLQLSHVVSPELLFRNYVYVSSTSQVFMAHFEEYATDLIRRFNLNKNSFVLDIGSNDGILLKPLKNQGIKVLGVDPAIQIAKTATGNGITTLPHFLDTNLAKRIVKKYGAAAVVCANNAFAHIHNLDEIIESVKILLKKGGVFVIEFPYLVNFLKQNLFDTIYHEHLSYLSLRPLKILFESFDMEIFDAIKTSSHGGSLRVFVQMKDAKHPVNASIAKLIKKEKSLNLNSVNTYLKFADKIEKNKKKLKILLKKLKSEGKTISGYGAPAKGNTLLMHFGIGSDDLNFIIDDSPYKQGLFTPGTHIPVVSSEALTKKNPDYILILAWNFAPSIMEKLGSYKKNGGSFIIPVPEPKII